MTIRRRAVLSILAVLLCAPLIYCSSSTRGVAVDRYDVALTVLADGSLAVQETIEARALTPGARFERDIPAVKVDRIFDVEASADGSPLAGDAGDARISRSGGLHVRWLLRSDTRTQTLKLHYRLLGALAAQETRGLLEWTAVSAGRSYPVTAMKVTLSVPHGAVFTAGPFINDGAMQRSGSAAEYAADLTAVDPHEQVRINGELDLGTINMAEPDWQTNAAQAWRLMPAFLAGGACLIAIAIGVIVMIRLQYLDRQLPTDAFVDVADVCSSPPALVAAVVSGRLSTTGWSRFATLLSLSQRGVLPSRAGGETSLTAHEQMMLDEVWLRNAQGAPISRADSTSVVQRSRRRVDLAIAGDLVQIGLADANHLAVRRGLRQTGWVAVAMSLLIALVIELVLSRLGIWPMAIPLSLLVMGIVFIRGADRVAFLTPRGGQARISWQTRLNELQSAARAGRVTGAEFERCLPVMVASGAGAEWSASWERIAPGSASERLTLLRQYTSRL